MKIESNAIELDVNVNDLWNASSETLAQVACCVADAPVLERIADNPHTDVETLVLLSTNSSADVRMAVAENEHAPLSILLTLAHDENPDVRYSIAENSHVDRLILEELVGDSNPYISWRALTTLRRMESAQPGLLRCAA